MSLLFFITLMALSCLVCLWTPLRTRPKEPLPKTLFDPFYLFSVLLDVIVVIDPLHRLRDKAPFLHLL